MRSALAAHSRKSDGDRRPFSFLEQVSHGQVFETISAFKVAMSSRSFSMDDALGDADTVSEWSAHGTSDSPLSVKVGQQIDQVKILEQERTGETRSLDGIGVRNRCTIGRCVDSFC